MDRYPVIVFIGAGLLGKVAGQMIMTDAFTQQLLAPNTALIYTVQALGATAVVAIGIWLKQRRT
jgi:predicted tellurium resistance membrane protein TerC